MQLRVCPFCGNRARMDSFKVGNQIRYFVRCSNKESCNVVPCTYGSVSMTEAAEWWNGEETINEEAKSS